MTTDILAAFRRAIRDARASRDHADNDAAAARNFTPFPRINDPADGRGWFAARAAVELVADASTAYDAAFTAYMSAVRVN